MMLFDKYPFDTLDEYYVDPTPFAMAYSSADRAVSVA